MSTTYQDPKEAGTRAGDIVAALERGAAVYRSYGGRARERRIADMHELFAGPKGANIREWFIKTHERQRSKGQPGAETAASRLCFLAMLVATRKPLSKWESLSAAKKERQVQAIKKHANALAALLESTDCLPVPSVLNLFDSKHVPDALPRGLASADVASELRPIYGQKLAPILRALASVAEERQHPRIRDSRPGTGEASARVLTREIVEWFSSTYSKRTPNETIANIVNLAMPKLAGLVDADQVREWSGKR